MLPLLSICIPTYNRCRYLPETLESILAQVTPEVEIVISDNASTDATRFVVAEYTAKYLNIHYSCADVNQGPDANFLRVVSLASGAYCWLLSDDDTVQRGAIATILREIRGGHDIYTFNETTCGNSLEPIGDQQRLAIPDGRVEYDLSNPADLALFFERSDPVGGIPFGLISVLVFKKSIWDTVKIPEAIMGTAYVHVYILLAGKDYGVRLKYIPQSLVMNRLNESYISTDPVRSFWITADGYLILADYLYTTQMLEQVRMAFLSIAKRIFNVRYIILLRIYSTKDSEWQSIETRLAYFGYSRTLLKMIGVNQLLLRGMRFLWQQAHSRISRLSSENSQPVK